MIPTKKYHYFYYFSIFSFFPNVKKKTINVITNANKAKIGIKSYPSGKKNPPIPNPINNKAWIIQITGNKTILFLTIFVIANIKTIIPKTILTIL